MLNEKILNIRSEKHYLRLVNCNYDKYLDYLKTIIDKLALVISEKSLNELVDKKLQLSLPGFNEAQFVQSACELSLMSRFILDNRFTFTYEKKLSPPKDVDFSVKLDNVTVNVEVKCPSYGGKILKREDGVVLASTGRLARKSDFEKITASIKKNLQGMNKSIHEEKSMDNNLKDFLLSTQDKVSSSDEKDINVLAICTDTAVDMQKWREYLFGYSGLFTDNGFISPCKFDRVDYVLLTNLYNRHYKYYECSLMYSSWDLSNAFCLLYPNTKSKRNRKIPYGKHDFDLVSRFFPNHSESFEKYLKDDKDLPCPSESPAMKNFLGIAWFSDKFRSKGIYYFKETRGI